MGTDNTWFEEKRQKLASLFGKIITDHIEAVILVLIVVIVLVVVFFYGISFFNAVLIPILYYGYVGAKEIRQRLLFRKSSTTVTANKGPNVLFCSPDTKETAGELYNQFRDFRARAVPSPPGSCPSVPDRAFTLYHDFLG